jgi:hypothetical protein
MEIQDTISVLEENMTPPDVLKTNCNIHIADENNHLIASILTDGTVIEALGAKVILDVKEE